MQSKLGWLGVQSRVGDQVRLVRRAKALVRRAVTLVRRADAR